MQLNSKAREWEDRYQSGTTHWDRGRTSGNLSYWLDKGLLKPCRILIPGCGNGYEVVTLARLGFDVVAIDIAPTAIENLQKMLHDAKLQAECVLGDFFSWQPEEKFDALFEQTSLCALPPALWAQYETQLHQWLIPQGQLFAQFMQTGNQGGPPYHCALSDMHQLFSMDRWKWSNEHPFSLEKEPGKIEFLYLLEKRIRHS